MKIERDTKFRPIVITIENQQDLDSLQHVIALGVDHPSTDLSIKKQILNDSPKQLLRKLIEYNS